MSTPAAGPFLPPLLTTILQITLLFFSLRAFLAAWTPPNPIASSDTKVEITIPKLIKDPETERWLASVTRVLVCVHFGLEGWAVLEGYLTSGGENGGSSGGLIGALCPSSNSNHSNPAYAILTLLPSLSLLLILFGSFIRTSAYAALGKMYTWEASILKSHRLVTSGPYAWVRHPGYTGLSLASAGYVGFMFSPGTVGRECLFGFGRGLDIRSILGTLYPIWMIIFSLDTCIFLVRRSYTEDELMKKNFGKEWEEWRVRVRWRVFPGVL